MQKLLWADSAFPGPRQSRGGTTGSSLCHLWGPFLRTSGLSVASTDEKEKKGEGAHAKFKSKAFPLRELQHITPSNITHGKDCLGFMTFLRGINHFCSLIQSKVVEEKCTLCPLNVSAL